MITARSRQCAAVCLLLSVGACARPVVISSRSVILRPEQTSKLAGTTMAEAWMPSAATVRELEMRLPAFIAQRTTIHRSIADDYKQYGGIVREGRRIVYVYAFNIPAGSQLPDWKRKPIVFGGGGDSVWQVEYDVEKKKFIRFEMQRSVRC